MASSAPRNPLPHLSVEGASAARGPLSPTTTYSTHQTPLGSPVVLQKTNNTGNSSAKPNVFFPASPVVTASSLSAAAASQSALLNSSANRVSSPLLPTTSSSSSHNNTMTLSTTVKTTGTGKTSVLDQAAQVMVLANQEPQMRIEDNKFELHPRLAYSCAELQRQTFVFLNERTLLFPVGLHLFKYDVGSQTIAAAALSAATAAAALASGELKAAPSVVAAPLPGVAIVAPDAGANNAATACMEFFFKRSYSVTPLLAISRNRARLAIAEDMENGGGSHSISSTAVAHHTRGHAAHQAAAGLSGSYRKAMISIIDLTADPPVLCWQFHHAHAGKLKSLDFSANGNLLAACIELDQSEPVAGNHARRRNKDTDSSRPGTGEDSQQETERSENGGWHEEKATEPDEHETPIHLQKSVSAVTVWRVDTHKFLATHTSDHMMHTVAINPDDNYLMVASGNKYIRYLKTVGTQLDEIPFLKRLLERTYHFSQHAWIDASILAALTEENEVLIFQKGQLKQVLAHQLSPATDKIISLTPYRDSFFLGSQDGTLIQVIPAKNAGGGPAVSAAAQLAAEKEREKEKSGAIQQAKLFKVNNEFQTHKGAISEMVISPNDGTMVVSVRDHGLSTFPMDLMGRWSEFETEPELSDIYLPCGDIVAMDACEQRSIVVTAATDHTVSIWSHLKHSPRASPCAIRHTFNEVPLAVAFHPSGYQLLVGFATHIGMFHLLRNSLKLSYSFQLYTRTVTPLLIKYSHGGERFAVATGVHLFIYSSVDFSLLQHIPGNSGIINAFEWSSDDTVLSCVNGEGAIYAWELKTLQRVFDHVEKGVEFHAMCLDWGKNWRKQTYQALHHGTSDTAGNRAITAAMKADGIEDAPAEGHDKSEGGNQPQVDRCQVLAAGATFTSYRLKTLTAAGIQDVKAKDFTNAAMNLNGEGEELALERISITHLIRDAQRNIILAGTSTGYVLIFRWPFVTKARDSMDVALGLAQHGVLDPTHANVLGKFLVHEGSIQHMVYLPLSGVLLTYGMDGNFFVLDLRVIDLKSFLTTPAGQVLAKAVPQDRKRQVMLAQAEEEAEANLMPISAEKKTRANALSVIHAQHRSYKLNKLTTIMIPKSVSNKKFEYQQHSYYGDSDLVLVKNSEYESILQEIRENSQDVRRMERTAEYQMSAQKDFYVQSLKTLRNDMESLLQSRENELSTTKNLLKLSESEKNAQSNQHKTDILELNTSWRTTLEKKMHESYLAMEKKTKEMNELDQMHIQEKKDLVAAHAKRVEDLRQEHKNQVSDLTNRVAELEVALKDSEQQYEEALTQLESEHDTQVVGLQRSSAAQRLKTREGTAILQAEVSAAKRKLEEKNDSLKALESVNNEKEDQLQHLAGVVRRLTQEMQQCKVQLREKEENITRRQHELAQARQDNGTLKNFLEILEHRIAELENRETPALETMIALKSQVESMSEELFELNKQKLLAQTLAERKQGESTRFSITANNLRHKLAKKEHAWENVQKELKYIVEHLGHSFQGTTKALPAGSSSNSGSSLSSGSINLHQDLKNLYANYFSSSAKETEQPDRSLIEKVENEATRQRVFLEKSLKRLRNANASIAARTKADGERALAHNINFLLEVNRLREENSRLFMRCGLYRSMVVQAGLGRKLDMIDSGEEGAAMALIEEEQKQAAAQNPKNSSAGKRLMASSGSEAELNSPPQQRPNAYAPTPSPGTSQKLLQSAGDNLHSPVPLFGLASQASKDTILAGSQSSATLPSLAAARSMKESQSTPALPFVSEGDDRSGSNVASISRIGGPRGKDALTIEGGAARAAREAAEIEAAARRSAGRSPSRGSTPSKGTTKAIAENSALKVKANELERRLEAVTNHASLQAVHISALQGAIRTAQEHASRGSELLGAGESFDGVPDVNEEDEEPEEDEELDDDGEERFFGIGNRPPSSASGTRPVSRGKLSPLRTSHGSPSLGASASTPSLSLAGTSAGTSSQAALRGQNATSAKGASSKLPPHGTLQPIDQSFHSIQANIESTLAGGSAKSSGRNSAKSGGIAAALDSATKNANARKSAKSK